MSLDQEDQLLGYRINIMKRLQSQNKETISLPKVKLFEFRITAVDLASSQVKGNIL